MSKADKYYCLSCGIELDNEESIDEYIVLEMNKMLSSVICENCFPPSGWEFMPRNFNIKTLRTFKYIKGKRTK